MISKSKYRYLFPLLFMLSMVAILATQVFYLKQSYETEKEAFKNELSSAIDRVEYSLIFQVNYLDIPDSGNVYSIEAAYADSTLLFEGRVKAREDAINQKYPFDSALLDIRKQQLDAIHETLIKYSVKNKALTEKIIVTISQQCTDCPGIDYRNYPIDSLIRVQLSSAGLPTDFDYGVVNKRTDKWEHLSEGADTTALRNDFTLKDYFVPSFTYSTEIYVLVKNERSLLIGRVMFSLLLSIALVLMVLFSFIYFVREISKQKKLSAIKNDFINNMTHEFKTPIANILLGVDNIENAKVIDKPELVKSFSTIIRKEGIRLNSFVESVLKTAQMEQEEIEINLEELDIHQLLQEIIKLWQPQIKKREGTLKLSMTSEKSRILADKVLLYSSISNLVDNANKYSPDKPEIHISTTRSEGFLQLTVSDKGLGISKKEIKNIFKKFYRVPTENLHNVKGFGIGLNYVKDVVNLMGGEVFVQSTPGKGRTFTLKLPLN